MQLATKDFNTLVEDSAAAVQGKSSQPIDLSPGSVLLAVIEADSTVSLWLQAQILQVLAVTRAATSSGSDLDFFVNDFGLTREAAVAATGQVTFSRFTATQQAVIPIGAQLQTADGSQQFTVTLDTTNVNYSAASTGYVLAANTASISVPVAAVTAGSGGNVLANTITTLQTGIPGVDTVTNAAAFTNGLDAETDSALRARFQNWVANLGKATKLAIGTAIESVQQGLTYTLTENQDYNGTTDMGYFYAVVDDGSGSPASSLLSTVYNAIDAVRPIGSRFAVFGPTKETANVNMTITTATGYTHSAVVANVVTALQNYINGLAMGQSLPYTMLSAVAYGVAGVTNVTGVTLNSGTSDLTATAQQIIKAGTLTVS